VIAGHSLRLEEVEAVHAKLYGVVVDLLGTQDIDFARFAKMHMADDDPMTSEEFAAILKTFQPGDIVSFSYRQAHTQMKDATSDRVYFLAEANGLMLCVSQNFFDTYARTGDALGTELRVHAAVDGQGDLHDLRKDGEIGPEMRPRLFEY